MLFGNWNITEDSIAWTGSKFQRFVVPANQLNNTRQNGDATGLLYDWILLATEEDWLTEDDLYDFNFAFVFAMAKYGHPFSYEIFDNTLDEQYEQFEAEENDNADV